MQVLFCHDGPIRVDKEGNYYGIAHNDEMFKRYFTIANKIATVIRVTPINNDESASNLSKINIEPFKVYQIPNINSVKGRIIDNNKTKKIIKNAVVESDYIVARLPSVSGMIAINYAKKYKKPYLTEVVACPWDAFWNHSLKGKFMAPSMYFKTKKYVRQSEYVVYVTNDFLQTRYPTNGKHINCSNVELKEINNNVLKNRIKKIKCESNNSKVIIGTTAAVNVRYKGQQYIIQALAELKSRGYTNFEYQLVGAGNENYLRTVAKKYNVINQVNFLGPKHHNEVFKWLDSINLYVQPSRQEGLPRALIEAMSRGLPAFGANTAGIPELLEEEFIFSNSKNNINEIISILLNYTDQKMLEQANINFNEAKKYEKGRIDNKRSQFFEEFTRRV